MISQEDKRTNALFEHFIDQIFSWYTDKHKKNDNDLSKMKIIKLHFFVCSLNNILLGKYKFLAMRYGPVCGELLEAINSDSLNTFRITNLNLEKKDSELLIINKKEDLDVKEAYNQAIEKLKNINNDIIDFSAFDLVKISHGWHSWQIAWDIAKDIGKEVYEMNSDKIKSDPLRSYA